MLWAVLNKWPSGAKFILNLYCHWATRDGSGHFLHSKEGVTQGDPLTMIAYVIRVLPLIRDIQRSHPHVTQPWHVSNAGAGGKFKHILAHLQDLQTQGPPRGYYQELTKIILVVAPHNLARSEEFLRGMGIQVVTKNRYLEGFIGDREAEKM